jgi:hypothetical protein
MAVMLFSCQISNENFFATRKEMIIGLNNWTAGLYWDNTFSFAICLGKESGFPL